MNIRELADIIERGENGEQLQVNYKGTWENASVDSCKSFHINYLLADNIRIKPVPKTVMMQMYAFGVQYVAYMVGDLGEQPLNGPRLKPIGQPFPVEVPE